MDEKSERLQILEMIEQGEISASEGVRLLKALDGETEQRDIPEDSSEAAQLNRAAPVVSDSFAEESTGPPKAGFQEQPSRPNFSRWRRWWTIPMWVGTGITIVGGALMYWAFQSTGTSFWFVCAWLPFLLGLAVMALAWSSRTSRWLHIRVQQKPGEHPERIALSFPLPIRLTAWILRHFGHHIPRLENTGIDEIILALENNTNSETPFYIEVDEGESGERVQIYIG